MKATMAWRCRAFVICDFNVIRFSDRPVTPPDEEVMAVLRTKVRTGPLFRKRSGVKQSSTARDPHFIGGLVPWALRHDLEALRRHERTREAESETSRTEDALAEKRLSESIWWNERFYLEMVRKGAVPKPPSDDEGSERPRKMPKSDEDEGPSDPRGPLMIMPPKHMSEARMREINRDQFATSMNEFMANMTSRAGGPGVASGSGGAGGSGGTGGNADGTGVRGTGPTVPELTGCTYATFIKCDPLPFNGTEGAYNLSFYFWCMSTRSSARNLFLPLDNPKLTIRRRSHANPTILNDFEMAAEGNGDLPVPDLRTMEELCQPSLNGRGGPISPIAIQAMNFRLKNDMIQQIQNSCQFHGLSGDDANKHLDKFLHVT
nr:reverse transcriptase domain-containing protein [Tanacetum cinerariifolium]